MHVIRDAPTLSFLGHLLPQWSGGRSIRQYLPLEPECLKPVRVRRVAADLKELCACFQWSECYSIHSYQVFMLCPCDLLVSLM